MTMYGKIQFFQECLNPKKIKIYNFSQRPFKKGGTPRINTIIKFTESPPLQKGDLGGFFQTI